MHHTGDVFLPVAPAGQDERSQVRQSYYRTLLWKPSPQKTPSLPRPALVLNFQVESRWAKQVRIERQRLAAFLEYARNPAQGQLSWEEFHRDRRLGESTITQLHLH